MDGFSETYWNGIQLLGWVYLGDREFVRRASDSVSDHGTFWQELKLPDGRNELVETPADPPNLIKLSLTAEWNGGAAYPSYADARDAVLTALQESRLHAWGLENGEGDLKEISAIQWAKLDFYQDKSHRIYASPDDHFRPGATKWHGLKFKRKEVLKIWPDPLENISPKHEPTGGALKQTWLRLPEIVGQVVEGSEISEAARELYRALANGLISAEAEIHRIYNEPVREGVIKFHLEWPRIEQLSRDWWVYGRARIDPPGSKTLQPNDPPVTAVFLQLIEKLAEEEMGGWELTLTKPYGNRAGGHPNDLDLATNVRCRRDDVERFFENERVSKLRRNSQESSKIPVENRLEADREGHKSHADWPVGSRSLEAADAPLIEEMRQALSDDKALSVWAAAGRIVDRAPGAGSSGQQAKASGQTL